MSVETTEAGGSDPSSETRRTVVLAAAPVDDAGLLLEVTFGRAPDPCEAFASATARETADQVELEVMVTVFPQPDGEVCPDVLVTETTTVELESPLGTRTVVDASSGEEVPREL